MATVAERALNRRTYRSFYTGMAIVIAAAVFLGFARTFYLRGYLPLPLGAGPGGPARPTRESRGVL